MLLVVLAAAAALYARSALSPLQEALRQGLGLTDGQLAILQGPVLAAPIIVAAVPLGLLIDRTSRARLMRVLMILIVVGVYLTAYASDLAELAIARGVVGFASMALNPVALSLISDRYAESQRGRATMAIALGQALGGAAVFAAGGYALQLLGPAPTSWRSAMLYLGLPLIPIALSMLALAEPRRHDVRLRNASSQQSFVELWQYRRALIPLLVGMAAMEMALGSAMTWGSPVLMRGFALSAGRSGAIMSFVTLMSGIAGPIGGGVLADLCQRLGGPQTTMIALAVLALLGVLCGLFAIAPGVGLASGGILIFVTAVSAACVMSTTLFIVIVPNELRGLCMGIATISNVLFSLGLAPIIVSGLSSATTATDALPAALAEVCVATSLLGVGAFFSAARQQR